MTSLECHNWIIRDTGLRYQKINLLSQPTAGTNTAIAWCLVQVVTSMKFHYSDVIMSAMASHITGVTIAYSTVCSDADKNPSKLRVTGLCEMHSPVTGEFPAQRASNAENAQIWWRHY